VICTSSAPPQTHCSASPLCQQFLMLLSRRLCCCCCCLFFNFNSAFAAAEVGCWHSPAPCAALAARPVPDGQQERAGRCKADTEPRKLGLGDPCSAGTPHLWLAGGGNGARAGPTAPLHPAAPRPPPLGLLPAAQPHVPCHGSGDGNPAAELANCFEKMPISAGVSPAPDPPTALLGCSGTFPSLFFIQLQQVGTHPAEQVV